MVITTLDKLMEINITGKEHIILNQTNKFFKVLGFKEQFMGKEEGQIKIIISHMDFLSKEKEQEKVWINMKMAKNIKANFWMTIGQDSVHIITKIKVIIEVNGLMISVMVMAVNITQMDHTMKDSGFKTKNMEKENFIKIIKSIGKII